MGNAYQNDEIKHRNRHLIGSQREIEFFERVESSREAMLDDLATDSGVNWCN
jgi:hypothetical protein